MDLQAFLEGFILEGLFAPYWAERGVGTLLRAFYSSALWQIYETLVTPLQDAEMQIYNCFLECRNANLQLLRMQES
jgi:hypothetical protein